MYRFCVEKPQKRHGFFQGYFHRDSKNTSCAQNVLKNVETGREIQIIYQNEFLRFFFNVLWKVIHLTLTPYLFSQTAIAFLLDSSHHSRKITKSAQNVTKSPETGRKFILLSRNWPFIFFGNSSWTLFTSHWHPMLLLTDISSCVRPFFKNL